MKNIREYLLSKGFEFKEANRPSGNNAIMVCPFCQGGEKHEKTFAVNLETGAWNCLRLNNCGEAGSFYSLQVKLGDRPLYVQTPKSRKRQTYSRPEPLPLLIATKNIDYLLSRGFDKQTIKDFRIFDSKSGEIGMPFYRDGTLVNAKYRTIDKKFRQEKNAEPCLFNRDNASGKTLTITEGELDCMSLCQYGFRSVVSLPSGTNDHRWIDNEWDFLEQFNTIYLCMDSDDAGRKAIDILIARLGRWRCRGVVFPHKDANDCLKNSTPKELMQGCFDDAIDYPPTQLVDVSEFVDEVFDLFKHPNKDRGVDTGFSGLTHYIGGWRGGELTVWTGQSGSGKTTMLTQVCLFLTNKGIKTCIASLELMPKRYLKWAVCQATGKAFPKETEINDVFGWLYRKMYILNSTDAIGQDQLFEVFGYAAMRYGVEHFVIDSLMMIQLSAHDIYVAQKDFVSRLTAFAKKYNAHIHLVAHPRKTASDRDTPGKVDVKGSGDITNLADNVLSVWRPEYTQSRPREENDPDTIVFVKKNRWTGEEGSFALWFDTLTKRFRCEGQEINFDVEGL